jgi:hypothetical protein
MPSLVKCPSCKICMDNITIIPRRFYHCFIENTFYDIIDGKPALVEDVYTLMNVSKEELDKLFYSKKEK